MKAKKNIQKIEKPKKLNGLPFKLRFFTKEDFVNNDPLKWAEIGAEVKKNYLVLKEDCTVKVSDRIGDVLYASSFQHDKNTIHVVREYFKAKGEDDRKIVDLTVGSFCEILNKIFLKRNFAKANNMEYGWPLVSYVSNVSKYVNRLLGISTIAYKDISVGEVIDIFEHFASSQKAKTIVLPIFLKHMQACLKEIETEVPTIQAVDNDGFIFKEFRIPFSEL